MSQLRWQCRRGMRELDQLLVDYLENRYEQADEPEKAAFCTLLTLSDPELLGYLLQHRPPAPELAHVVQRILHPTDA